MQKSGDIATFKTYVDEGIQLKKEGKLALAIKKFSKALQLKPKYVPALDQLAGIYESRKEFDQAIIYLQRVIKFQPNKGIAHARLAKAMMGQKNIQGAIDNYQKAIALQPKQPAWVYHGLGDALNQNGQLDEAISAYQKAIELEPDYPDFYLSPAKLHFENRYVDIEETISAYQKAIELKPDHPYFYLSLAKLHFEKGDLDSVIGNYRQAISLKQSNPLPLWVYKRLGEALRLQGRGDEATTSLKSTLHIKEKSEKKKYKIVVCATFKNEAPYLLEWLAYHRIMKVDHFLIYNNDSTDETPEILKALDRAGILTYIDWPSNPNQNNQLAAYKDAYIRLVGKCEWVAFIDGDEFIVPNNKYNDLHSFLSDYEDVAGIAINWKMFGSSGQLCKTDGLVMERFKRCAKANYPSNLHFKTIGRTDLIEGFITVHNCKFPKDGIYVYPDRTLVPRHCIGKGKYINHKIIQINHYFTKSKEEWDLKRKRGRATIKFNDHKKIRPESLFSKNDRNEDEDLTILRFLEKTKQEIKFLTEVAGLEPIVTKLSSKNKIQTVELATAPLLTAKAINFLKDFLKQKPDAKVLEFGSGASTVWLSQFTKNLVSIEHHPEWYEKVKSNIAKNDDCNPVDIRLLPKPYHKVYEEFPDNFFDLIIVDGRDRVKCLEASIKILKKGGILILDDAQRERYQKAHYLLQDWEFTRTISPARQTHWWEKPLREKSVSKEWSKVLGKDLIRLYAGNLTPRAKTDGWIGVSIRHSDEHHIKHDLTKPFPISDGVVDAFQSEEAFQKINPSKLLEVTFPEIYRIMKPGGLIRISVPDYRCDVLLERLWKDEQGKPYYDPGPSGQGKSGPVDKSVAHRGHVWFPTYEQLWSLIEMSPLRYCQAHWLHYYDCTGKPVMNEIDYSKGFIKRTPDHDPRVQNPLRPMSIVVDLYK